MWPLIFCVLQCSCFGFSFILLLVFYYYYPGIFHQRMAVKYFSHMKFMKNIHWHQAFLNCGIYQTGIFYYVTILCCLSSSCRYIPLLFWGKLYITRHARICYWLIGPAVGLCFTYCETSESGKSLGWDLWSFVSFGEWGGIWGVLG